MNYPDAFLMVSFLRHSPPRPTDFSRLLAHQCTHIHTSREPCKSTKASVRHNQGTSHTNQPRNKAVRREAGGTGGTGLGTDTEIISGKLFKMTHDPASYTYFNFAVNRNFNFGGKVWYFW